MIIFCFFILWYQKMRFLCGLRKMFRKMSPSVTLIQLYNLNFQLHAGNLFSWISLFWRRFNNMNSYVISFLPYFCQFFLSFVYFWKIKGNYYPFLIKIRYYELIKIYFSPRWWLCSCFQELLYQLLFLNQSVAV